MPRRSFTANAGLRRQRSDSLRPFSVKARSDGLQIKRRPKTPPTEQPVTSFVPPVRLRFVLLLAVGSLTLYSAIPRAVAYWKLHSAATDFADYAMCMVGPTGPSGLKAEPAQFRRLVRRRLVSARPESRPFAKCSKPLAGLGANSHRLEAHLAPASQFKEYGSSAKGAYSVSDLEVTASFLESLSRQAQPFSRGYSKLVQPSRNARSVPHPVDLPRPLKGKGLPSRSLGFSAQSRHEGEILLVTGRGANRQAFRSADEGITWRVTDPSSAEAVGTQGRCGTGDHEVEFRLSLGDERLRIESWSAGVLETSFPLASADSVLRDFACDGDAALAVTRSLQSQKFSLQICPHLRSCRALQLPAVLSDSRRTDLLFSVTRSGGTIVVAFARRGIVRVVSSRDDGATWTPPTVAYDRAELQGDQAAAIPDKLLAVGRKVILYAGETSYSSTYPLLMSEDSGASWTYRPSMGR